MSILSKDLQKKSDVFSNFPRQQLRQSRSRISFNWSRRRTTTSTSTSTTSTDTPFRRFLERRSPIGPRSVLGAEQCLCQTWESHGNPKEKWRGSISHDGSGWCWEKNANIELVVYWWDPWHTIYSSTMDPMGIKIIWKFRFLMGSMEVYRREMNL